MKVEIPIMILILSLIAFLLLGLSIGVYVSQYGFTLDGFSFFSLGKISYSNYTNCKGKDLRDIAFCLRDYVQTFYNYTTRDDIDRSFEDIKENGGDCYDYSHLYEKIARGLDLNTRVDYIYGNDDGHSFTVIWDDSLTGYCKLDMMDVDCIKLIDAGK